MEYKSNCHSRWGVQWWIQAEGMDEEVIIWVMYSTAVSYIRVKMALITSPCPDQLCVIDGIGEREVVGGGGEGKLKTQT